MGRHRSRTKVRRGVAGWPIAVVCLIAVVALAWLGWRWVETTLAERAAAQSHGCPQGESVLRVAVVPSATEPVDQAARRWNERRTVVYDHCVRVQVVSMDSEKVLAGLTGGWNADQLGPRPQAWLPESSYWVNRLSASNNALLGSAPESVASSPVVLAVPEEGARALTDGNSFRWGDIAELTSAPDGWARYGRPDWGRFRLAIPTPASNSASGLAIQCALAAASPQSAGPVTPQTLTLPAVQQSLSRLASSGPANVPATTRDALIALADAERLRDAPFAAVPVTEVDLFRRNLGFDGKPAGRPLFEVAARGPSPSADFPFISLAGTGVDQTQIRAAQKFREFLKEADQQREFSRAGMRASGAAEYPRYAPGIRWDSATTSLVPADANTTQQISATWASAAAGGQVVTVLVDVSRSMLQDGGDGRTRIDWVKSALHGLVDRTAAGSLGIWEFSRKLDGDRPYRQLVPTRSATEQRQALHAGVDRLAPASATHLYTSVDAVYRAALQNFAEGKQNRVVVLTDGPNDGGMSFSTLREHLRELSGGKRKVPISIIAIGPDPDHAELGQITRLTGGTLSRLTDARGVDAALGQLLSVRN